MVLWGLHSLETKFSATPMKTRQSREGYSIQGGGAATLGEGTAPESTVGWTLKLEVQVTSKGTGPSLPFQLLDSTQCQDHLSPPSKTFPFQS